MSYCPTCHHEYAESVERCIECGRRLRPGRRPVRYSLDLDDFVVPVGALVCGVVALTMLYLRVGAQFGWVTGPLATLVQVGQPPCMTVFYAVAAIACVLILTFWTIQVLILRR